MSESHAPGVVAIPATEMMHTGSVSSFIGLRQSLPSGSKMLIGTMSSSPAANRNGMAESILSHEEFQWILFLDSDMMPDPATALRLLDHRVDMVGALCYMRGYPFSPCCNPMFEPPTGLREVDWVGTGSLLVRRHVMETIKYPWFEHTLPGTGEDILFCHKARKAGFKVHVDLDLVVGHMATVPITREMAYVGRHLLKPPADTATMHTPRFYAENTLRMREAEDRS